jgi:diguanylate cyclase (GGDEF)-like protein
MTISVGIAVHTERDTTFDKMLHRADQALYAAKTGGRDQVEVAA